MEGIILLEMLPKNTAQLADWQAKDSIVEKINQIVASVNVLIAREESRSQNEMLAEKDKNAGNIPGPENGGA